MIFELAALGAALCWSLSSLVSANPSRVLGAVAFTRLRMLLVAVILMIWSTASGGLLSTDGGAIGWIILSGVIGIVLGDTALFLTMNRIGPRRTSVLFALNAPISALLGWILLSETLSWKELCGVLICFAGVLLAIVFGKRRSQLHQWETVKGPLWVGVGFGLGAALFQSVGALIARPVMEAGSIDAVTASAVRTAASAAFLTILIQAPFPQFKPQAPLTWTLLWEVALSGILGMGIGMTLLLFALKGGEVGLVSTLSATAPAISLPLIWLHTKERPALGAWVGAALVALGCGFIFGAI